MENGDLDSSSGGCSPTQFPTCPVGQNAHVVVSDLIDSDSCQATQVRTHPQLSP